MRHRSRFAPAVAAIVSALAWPPPAAAQAAGSTAAQAAPQDPLPSVELPADLARVLRDYEREWAAGNATGLAALFAEDGFALPSGRPPVRGRAAIADNYRNAGGPLRLRALAFAAEDSVAWIVGGYGYGEGGPDRGKFVLALRRGPDGAWLIAADIDNANPRTDP